MSCFWDLMETKSHVEYRHTVTGTAAKSDVFHVVTKVADSQACLKAPFHQAILQPMVFVFGATLDNNFHGATP